MKLVSKNMLLCPNTVRKKWLLIQNLSVKMVTHPNVFSKIWFSIQKLSGKSGYRGTGTSYVLALKYR